ncbi:MAG: pyrimidine dimer DNA glycosylase/endonuclease V [Dehalococcoidia bacterium]
MRIWDVPVEELCRQHLLGEHRELHAVWSILTNDKTGYSRHPETMRWKGHLPALAQRHDQQVSEMVRRGYSHKSPLPLAEGPLTMPALIDPVEEQRRMLMSRDCECLPGG